MANALSLPDPRLSMQPPVGTMPAPAPMQQKPPVANALATPSPYAPAPKKPQNALLAAAVDGFQRGFDPAGRQQRIDQSKADGLEKAKQTLALMQQQRALPTEQRAQWWTENAPQIGQIIGQDLTQQPVDPSKFTDQELDGQIAMLSGQLGIAPTSPEPMSEYERDLIRLKEQEAGQPRHQFLQGQDGSLAVGNLTDGTIQELRPGQPKPDPANYDMVTTADGVIAVNKRNPNDKIRIGAPPARSGGSNEPPSGYRWKADGSLERIPGGPADKPSAPAYDAPTARKYLSQAQTLDSLDGAINQYMALIEKHGPQIQTTGINGDNTIAAQLDAARTAIDIQTKELFNLGVLNGPDLDIIRGAIPDVTGFEAWGKTGDSVGASMNVLRDYITRGRNQIPPEIIARARPNGAPVGQSQATGSQDNSFWHRLSEAANQDDELDAHIDSLFPADDGGATELPAGVTQEEWDVMTPEEQALFQ